MRCELCGDLPWLEIKFKLFCGFLHRKTNYWVLQILAGVRFGFWIAANERKTSACIKHTTLMLKLQLKKAGLRRLSVLLVNIPPRFFIRPASIIPVFGLQSLMPCFVVSLLSLSPVDNLLTSLLMAL